MIAVLRALALFVGDLFKSRRRLKAENLILQHQLNIALRRSHPPLRNGDRVLLMLMTRLWPSLLGVVRVVQPETVLRWHRTGFRMFWRWKSRRRAGRPRIDRGLRELIRRISEENPSVGRFANPWRVVDARVRSRPIDCVKIPNRPPSQTWKTFLGNHADAIAAIDMVVVRP